ncbi:hypothetical protein [Phenylobacterium sp.]|jgi:hypothetical protein|uniref:hypothetical protein n=1 Tax=Phenylobacterium sp. TaxID=1871053 RepID=UPI002E318AC6|nr:hypothetical protein [Phenylobacterium sp.]HEX2560688.1 hypothetical protein [Phenylobacterium sp.]
MVLLAAGLGALAGPTSAAGLTEASVRRYLVAQERAWNERRLDAYFAGFAPDAVFVDQHKTPKETIVYGRSGLAEAKAAARRFLATSTSAERGTVRSIRIAPSGRTARVLGFEVSTVTTGGLVRRVCAETDQTLVLAAGRVLSKGQTDSIVKCPPSAA